MPEFKYVAGKEGIQELWRRIRAEIGKFKSFQPAEAAQDDTPNIAPEDRKTNIIYLVEEAGATPPDLYKEWIWTLPEGSEGEWVCIGDTSMDLSDMAKKSEMSVETVQGDPTKKTIQLKTNLAQEVVIEHQDISGKQDVISDLGAIRTGAAAGATAYQKPNTGIPSSDMTATVQASLGLADSAIQHVYAGTDELIPDNTRTVTIPYAENGNIPSHTAIIGGRTYRTVTMPDGKEWLAENLDYKFSGCIIGQSDASESEPHANYYNDDETTYGVTGNKYGLLYNWVAAKYLNDNKDTLIPGWHVPTKEEWDNMIESAGGVELAGSILKSTENWSSSGGGEDTYEFSAFPSGYREGSMTTPFFSYVGDRGLYWSLTEYPSSSRISYFYYLVSGYASIYSGGDYKSHEMAIRLVKDTPLEPASPPKGGLMTISMVEKLDGIEAHAQVNVQADWNVSDNTSDAFIKNKPSLATVATSGSYTDLSNKPNLDNYAEKSTTVTSVTWDSSTSKLSQTINGTSTEIVDLSGMETVTNKVTSVRDTSTATDTAYPSEKAVATALATKQGNLEFDGTYDPSTNKVATESTVADAISGLSGCTVKYTAGTGELHLDFRPANS